MEWGGFWRVVGAPAPGTYQWRRGSFASDRRHLHLGDPPLRDSGRSQLAFQRKWMPMDPKPRLNHRLYLETLRRMTPEQRLLNAFELSAFARRLFVEGLRARFPELPESEFQALLRARLDRCRNRNY